MKSLLGPFPAFTLAFCLLFIVGSGFAQTGEGAPPPNTPPDIVSITLDTSVVYLQCKTGSGSTDCPDKPPRVKVTAEAKDKEDDLLTFTYQVKTGRIVGQGRTVYWDLTGSFPGVHTITAIADDGGGPKGKRITKEVEVRECTDCDRRP
jgi:hypothetical protein